MQQSDFVLGIARGVVEFVRAAPPHQQFTIDWIPTWNRRTLSAWRGDGLIGELMAPRLQAFNIPRDMSVVNVSSTRCPTVCSVIVDNFRIGQMGCEHLLERGFRELHFIGYSHVYYSQQRWLGFEAQAKQAGIHAACYNLHANKQTLKTSQPRRGLKSWLSKQPRPMGVMLANDYLATLFYDCCSSLQLRIPDDVCVIGSDNLPMLTGLLQPSLSSINTDFEHLGFEAARTMAMQLQGRRLPPDHLVLIPPRSVTLCQSSDVFIHDDPLVAQALQIITRLAHQPVRVADVVGHMTCSRRTLEMRFLKHRGRSLLEEITLARINHVKRQLMESRRTVTQIAADSGFTYPTKFFALFKKYVGVTPSVYRQRHASPA